MSEKENARYPGEGGIGEAYALMHKERREEVEQVLPMWNVKSLVGQIAAVENEIAPLKRQIDDLETERVALIERLRRIMGFDV